MKNIWKALGIAALAATIPVRVKRDKTTGKRRYQSLLLSVDVGPGEDGEGTDIGINFGEGLINSAIADAVHAKKEAGLFTDDPDEAVLFADDEPEAGSPAPTEVKEIPQTEEGVDSIVTEEDFDPDL